MYFFKNRMLGYNIAIYDDDDNEWQFDRVNDSSVTCYIKFSDKNFTYLQSVANTNDKDVDIVEADHIIIGESMVYSSPETLEGIYKNSFLLYSLIMSKRNSLIELVTTDKQRKSEFKIKTQQYLLLPILYLNSFISYSPMKFPKSSTGYNI